MNAAAEQAQASMLEHARALAARGWRVHPLRAGTKIPLLKDWPNRATADETATRDWWREWPAANIGIATGAASGIVVIDVDVKGGAPGRESLEELRRVHGIPNTLTARTPSGGWHCYLKHPGGDVRNRAGLLPGIDIRGDGGYIVAPGSVIGGRPYHWIVEEPVADMPASLAAALNSNPRREYVPGADEDVIPQGSRNDALCRMAGAMRRRGMSTETIAAALLAENATKCSPPLPEAEVRRIAESVGRYSPAADNEHSDSRSEAVRIEDFRAYLPEHRYIYMPCRALWPASSVDGRVPWPSVDINGEQKEIRPSRWLDKHAPVECMTWWPGEPQLIRDRLVDVQGGWFHHGGCTTFNLYRPPTLQHGNADEAGLWLDHVLKVYGDDGDHLVRWLAHRVQRPGEKVNHALVLGGAQGIGKDTILEPVKQAVGPWNFAEVSPATLLGRFNPFVKSVILRVSEARDLGDVDRFAFDDHRKTSTAAPPDVLRCDEKNIREHAVVNVCGVVITTNHKSDGIYLPADDRRHFVAWSELDKGAFTEGYWSRLWRWYAAGGIEHVAAYLATVDLSDFDPKAPPSKTEAFWHIVDAARAPEESELGDLLDAIGHPKALTLGELVGKAEILNPTFADWLKDRKNRRTIPHRLEGAGYVPVRNSASPSDGQWRVDGRRVAVYARRDLALRDRIAAAATLARR